MAEYRKTLGDKLAHFFGDASMPCRLNTARNVVAARMGNPRPVQPWLLQVEVTNRCNLNCVFCSRHEHELQLGDLPPEFYDQVVELSAKAQEVALFGYGEPLMSRAFFDLLPRLQSSRIGFFTNGMLLDGKLFRKVHSLSNRPLHYIVYSIDGGTAATFERLRCGATFDKVWSNLAEVAAMRAQVGSKVTLRIEFVAMRNNVRELPEVLRLAEAAGVDMVKVSHLVVWDEALRDESLFYHQDLCREAFALAREAARGKRVALDLPKTFGEAEPFSPPCRMPWYYAMISYEGDVRACCFAPELTMGSLRDSSFSSIWMQERYQRLRELMASGKAPVACQRCENRFRYHASPDEERTYVKLTPRQK